MGADWRDSQIRYLVHFDDGRSGMRHRDEPLEVGFELVDHGHRYRVTRVEPPPNPAAFGARVGHSARVAARTRMTLPRRVSKRFPKVVADLSDEQEATRKPRVKQGFRGGRTWDRTRDLPRVKRALSR